MILDKLRALFTAIQFILTVSIVIILMYIFKKNTHKIRFAWSKMQLFLMGVDLQIKGQIDNNADMFILNHQSILDIVLFEALCKRDLAWVAKKEIANIPWFGHILKAPKMIVVERESKTSLVKLLKDAKDRYNKKRPIAIFPEGTRTDGKKLRKFKVGAKMIAQKYDMLVQPIVVVGTKEIFDSQKFNQKPGKVKVIFLPSIKAEKKSTWYKQSEELMAQTLTKELQNDI